MKTFEIVWFFIIMLLCAVADMKNNIITVALVALTVPFVGLLISKAAKDVADNEVKKEKESVKKALGE